MSAYRDGAPALDHRIERALAHEQAVSIPLVSLRASIVLAFVFTASWTGERLWWYGTLAALGVIALTTLGTIRRLRRVARVRRTLLDARSLAAILEGPAPREGLRRVALDLVDGSSFELTLPAEVAERALEALAESRPGLSQSRNEPDFAAARARIREVPSEDS